MSADSVDPNRHDLHARAAEAAVGILSAVLLDDGSQLSPESRRALESLSDGFHDIAQIERSYGDTVWTRAAEIWENETAELRRDNEES